MRLPEGRAHKRAVRSLKATLGKLQDMLEDTGEHWELFRGN